MFAEEIIEFRGDHVYLCDEASQNKDGSWNITCDGKEFKSVPKERVQVKVQKSLKSHKFYDCERVSANDDGSWKLRWIGGETGPPPGKQIGDVSFAAPNGYIKGGIVGAIQTQLRELGFFAQGGT